RLIGVGRWGVSGATKRAASGPRPSRLVSSAGFVRAAHGVKQGLETRHIAAADRRLRPAGEQHRKRAGRLAVQAEDCFAAANGRAVDPDEARRIELLLEHLQGGAGETGGIARVHPGIIAMALNPLDLVPPDADEGAVAMDPQAVEQRPGFGAAAT